MQLVDQRLVSLYYPSPPTMHYVEGYDDSRHMDAAMYVSAVVSMQMGRRELTTAIVDDSLSVQHVHQHFSSLDVASLLKS